MKQHNQGKFHPVTYASSTVSAVEKYYSVTDLMTLALVSTLKHFKNFISVYPITVQRKHHPLVGLFNNRHFQDRLARWFFSMRGFNSVFKYVDQRQDDVRRLVIQIFKE